MRLFDGANHSIYVEFKANKYSGAKAYKYSLSDFDYACSTYSDMCSSASPGEEIHARLIKPKFKCLPVSWPK